MNSYNMHSHPKVSIQKSTYQDIDLGSLLKPLGGFKGFINKGERVLLKTNLLNATVPEKAVVTNPLFISAVVKSVQNVGGIPYIGDSPSGNLSKRRLEKVYRKAGLIQLSKDLGIELNYDTGHKKIQIPDGKQLKNTRICNFVLNADKIIALPKIKTHSLMMMTLATKIMYGAIPGITKAIYHSRFIKRVHFAEMLLDVLSITTPHLVIMDGIIGMQGDGPMSGDPIDLGMVLASDNSIALDLAVCYALNIEPMGIPTLKQAKIRKLWPEKINYPLLTPEQVQYNGFILPSTANHLLTGNKKPKDYPIIKDNCTSCGECVEICPKKAISLNKEKAEVDYINCIKCYCCHEICMYNAINLDSIT